MGTLGELIGMAGNDTGHANVTFIVEDTTELNNSVVHLSPVTMEDLNIWYGVAILLEGSNNRKAVCTVLTDENCGKGKIRMNKVVRNKFGVFLGDSVSLRSFHEIPKGRKIVVRPIRNKSQKREFVQENLFESYLRPYFFGANRPVNNGDVFSVRGLSKTIRFEVITTTPSPFCIVGPSTIINCKELKSSNKRRRNESTVVSKKVKGPPVSLQSSVRPPAQIADTLPTQNADALPAQNVKSVPETNAGKLPLQNGETSSASEPTTLEDKIKLAYSLQKQGELKRAARAFNDVLNTQNKQLGHSHPEMLPFKQTLAAILFDLSQFHKLTELFFEDKQMQSNNGRAFLDTKLFVIMFFTYKNKYEHAAGILFRSKEHVNSLQHSFVEVLKIRVVFASVLYCQNRLEQALKLLTLSLPLSPTFLGNDTLVVVLKRLSNLENLKLHCLDPKYPDALIIKYHIGWFYYKLQDYFPAIKILQEILPLMKETMGSDHLCSKLTDGLLKVCTEQTLRESLML